MYAALRMRRRLRRDEAEITVVEPQPYMTYQPFLAEAASGAIDPRHVVVPLRRALRGCTVVTGEVTGLDHAARLARAATPATRSTGAPDLEIPYDLLVLAPGAVSRTLPVPGLAEHGIGFTTVGEAVGLRNHVLEQLDIASSTRDPAIREAALTFVFVGGGYAGVEALAELEDMARHATRYYHNVTPDDLRWVLVEAAGRILPEVDPALGRYTLSELRGRNVEVRLSTRLESFADRIVVLSDGSRFAARTLVWTAGVRPAPVLAGTGLPRDARGRVRCDTFLRIAGTGGAWAAGDCAAVPDLTRPGETCAPNAQHAVRQARTLGDNVVAHLRGEPQAEYRHAHTGAAASLGLHKGVAQLLGRRVTGRPAWLLHRAYHLGRMPTLDRKARVLADWLLAGLSGREVVSLGSLEHPRAEFEAAMGRAPAAPPRHSGPPEPPEPPARPGG
ncbi:NAD(P)/FAD-dependent oxidoreductase [Streptomyces sp. NPDC001380]|uniref:NAD(P)/FAD-dependent oxidoreductase n=1 Tax=Streptomyces sp. NPDC001380 TaxID=3364566 RepID=UPI003680BA2E